MSLIGIDQKLSTIKTAQQSNFFLEVSTLKRSKNIIDSRIVFVATGIHDMAKIFSDLARISFNNKIIVSDVGSIKVDIFKQALKILPKHYDFVGGHPIAGTEKIGFKNLVTDLFKDKPVFISGIRAKKDSVKLIKEIWNGLGGHVYLVSPEQHDKIFAHLSHLPHDRVQRYNIRWRIRRMVEFRRAFHGASKLLDKHANQLSHISDAIAACLFQSRHNV